jgi:hypothetical protein
LPYCQNHSPRRTEQTGKFFRILPLNQFSHKRNIATSTECSASAGDHHNAN